MKNKLNISDYCHDLRNESEISSSRVQGCCLLLVWGATSYKGKAYLVGIDGSMESEYYIKILQESLLPVEDAFNEKTGRFNRIMRPLTYLLKLNCF